MKINKILSICAAMALLSSGCSDDLGLQPDNAPVAGTGQTVRITASMGDNGSRLAFNETDTEVTLSWEQGDILKVLNPTRDTLITDFALVDGEGTSLANFEGTPANAYVEGDPLYALYFNDLVETDLDKDGNVTITIKEQQGVLNEDYQIMFGQAVYEADNALPSIKLENVISVLKLTIPTNKTLTEVTLDDFRFHSKATLVLQNSPSDALNQTFHTGDLVYSYDKFGNDSCITVKGQFEPIKGEVTIYLYVLPAMRYESEWDWSESTVASLSFTALDSDSVEYLSTRSASDRWFESGKMYEVSSGIFALVDFENESHANGTVAKPYEIATTEQLYSFMMRCKKRMVDKEGNDYRHLHYRLSSDIVLDSRLSWDFFNFYGTFDGDGHTISGSIEKPLFSYVEGATISNLILDMDYKIEGSYDFFGCLATVMHNSSIINVVNRSSVDVYAEFMGGLVGALFSNSTMIGCVNTGHLTDLYNEVMYMGGLVGDLREGSTIEACYNTGNLTAQKVNGGNNSYFGGIVGYICEMWDYDNNLVGYDGTLTSCWSTGTLTIGSGYNPSVGDITGIGTYTSCFKVDTTPTAEQITEMNAAMTNALYEFDAAGNIVAKKPSTSLPDIEIEDF